MVHHVEVLVVDYVMVCVLVAVLVVLVHVLVAVLVVVLADVDHRVVQVVLDVLDVEQVVLVHQVLLEKV